MWLGWGRGNGCVQHYRCKSGLKGSYQRGPKDRGKGLEQVTQGSPHAGLCWVVMKVVPSRVRNWNAPRIRAGDMSEEGHEEGTAIWRTHILTEDSRKLPMQERRPSVARASLFSRKVGNLYCYLLITNSLQARSDLRVARF